MESARWPTTCCATALDAASFTVGISDVPLHTGWNLVAAPVQPHNPDIDVVQRPISGTYAAILGYQGGLQWHYPAGPYTGSLAALIGGRGYWVRETRVVPPAGEEWEVPAVATLRLAGKRLAEDQPLLLAAGWNLAGYLPFANLPVTTALQTIDGQYAAVLGYGGTGQSYYPDLDDNYNTLLQMTPSAGYWISATKAITLQYPTANRVPVTTTLSTTATRTLDDHLVLVREAEKAAGVTPTYRWANLYGRVYLLDGSPAPISSTVTVLADGVPCGATMVTDAGHFGLLACYGDDATTGTRDGAQPSAALTFLLDGAVVVAQPVGFNGHPVTPQQPMTWTGHGDRWELVLGSAAPAVDLAITKTVSPTVVLPGASITYTLAYSNAGSLLAAGVVITDLLPTEISDPAFTGGGELTDTDDGRIITWHVAELAPDAGGVITVTGVVSPALTGGLTITNTAGISGPGDAMLANNRAQAVLKVAEVPAVLKPAIWLPCIVRQ